jgi:predicted transcriptional regulator
MRTTVRIDDDLLDRLKARAAAEKTSLTRLVNRVIRSGLASLDHVADKPRHIEETYAMGEPNVDLGKAIALAAALEDEETLRKLGLRK